jgi:pimeloyl-ACP methyl ester carboxylesterase
MITHLKSANDNERSDTLLVFLPGAYLKPDEFEREGFISAVRERHLAADSLLVDADVSYYYDQTLSERLHADVIEPQRAKGYKSIWLVGISIGGFGALVHELSRPGSVDGIVALAPYLGRRVLGAEILKAGGLRAWQAPAGPLPDEEVDRKLWPWFQRYLEPQSSRACRSSISDSASATVLPATTSCWPMRCPKAGCSPPRAATTGRSGANCGATCSTCCRCRRSAVRVQWLRGHLLRRLGCHQRSHGPSRLDVEGIALAGLRQP